MRTSIYMTKKNINILNLDKILCQLLGTCFEQHCVTTYGDIKYETYKELISKTKQS